MQTLTGSVLFSGDRAGHSWPQLWDRTQVELKQRGYRRNTRRLYRHVLRSVSRYVRVTPDRVREWHLRDYLAWQANRGATGSWLSANITVLRMVFDKLGGLNLTRHMVTPRRPWPLPHILTLDEVRRVLSAAPTLRDQLLLGLLYGCGLKVGELCRLRWGDIAMTDSAGVPSGDGSLPASGGASPSGLLQLTPTRQIPIPSDLLPVLSEGLARCPATDFIFPGARPGKPLSDRMVAFILQQAVKTTGMEKPVDGMVLRHSFGVHCLEAGLTIRAVQQFLGHKQVATTMIYQRLLHPGVTSPLDSLPPPAVPAPLLPAPLTTEGLTLPFAPEAPDATRTVRVFYQALRTRLVGGFLALKRVIRASE
jgi:integrase/recombinase XerD